MNNYVTSISTAIIIFPIIAFLFTVPYILYQYRKYGAIPIMRTLIIYSFILYFICIYFLAILPLPSIDKVVSLKTAYTQLIPFQFVSDFLNESGFIITKVSTYFSAFKHPSFYNVVFNILMFMPFGIYLRYYFKCSFKKTFFISFLISLFIEVTQLSGLYGIYPRPYRLFDVDDLMMNSIGGILGYFMTPLLSFFLPSRDRIDEVSYEKGEHVNFYRRLVALFIDWFILLVLFIIFKVDSKLWLPIVIIYFSVLSYITNGRTIGKWFIRIKLVSLDETKAKLWQSIVRYFILYGIILTAPAYGLILISYMVNQDLWMVLLLFLMGFIILFFYLQFLFQILRSMLFSKKLFSYEVVSKTKHISTIRIKEKTTTSSQL